VMRVMEMTYGLVVMRLFWVVVTALGLSLAATGEGRADCNIKAGDKGLAKNFEIRPDQSSSMTLVWILENANSCSIRVLMPSEYSVTSISLLGQPANGNVKQISQNLFDYNKSPQYWGTDRFGVKVCGKKSFGTSSCSTVTYQIDSVKK
jgi:hypothetical protein